MRAPLQKMYDELETIHDQVVAEVRAMAEEARRWPRARALKVPKVRTGRRSSTVKARSAAEGEADACRGQ